MKIQNGAITHFIAIKLRDFITVKANKITGRLRSVVIYITSTNIQFINIRSLMDSWSCGAQSGDTSPCPSRG